MGMQITGKRRGEGEDRRQTFVANADAADPSNGPSAVLAFHPLETLEVNAVRAALERLIAEDGARLSERNRRFLAFVVSETLAGRAHRIKAYTIGVDVFGRGADFDPVNDPIVRIEATRIRSALSEYYERAGARDRMRILIPPGSYAPVFAAASELDLMDEERAAPAIKNSADAAEQTRRPAIVIKTCAVSLESPAAMLVTMLAQSAAAKLRALRVKVYMTPSPERKAAMRAVEEMLLRPNSVYALDVMLHPTTLGFRQCWSLVDLRSGELLDSIVDRDLTGDLPSPKEVDSIIDLVTAMVERALGL